MSSVYASRLAKNIAARKAASKSGAGRAAVTGGTIVTIGPHVIDEIVTDTPQRGRISKRESTVALKNGGGAVNVARQARALGAKVREVLFLGDDESSSLARRIIRSEFPESLPVCALKQTRRSIWVGEDAHIVRSPLKIRRVPAAARTMLQRAFFVVVAPMTPADAPVIQDILVLCPRSVLQLSAAQLVDRKVVRELARKAWLVAINATELELWTRTNDIQAALGIVRGYGVSRLIVTSEEGAAGFVGEAQFEIENLPVAQVRQTRGAGDLLLATLLVALNEGIAWPDAVRCGLVAAAAYVEGNEIRYGSRKYLWRKIKHRG